MNNIRQHNNVY